MWRARGGPPGRLLCRLGSVLSLVALTVWQVGSRNWADSSVTSGYLLPTVGPVDDGEEARAKAAALRESLAARR